MRSFFIRWFFPESDIHKKYNNEQEGIHEGNVVSKLIKIYHCFLAFSLKILAAIKDMIPSINLNVNLNTSSNELIGAKLGWIKRSVNHAADKFTNNSESISIQVSEDKFIALEYIDLKLLSNIKNKNSGL